MMFLLPLAMENVTLKVEKTSAPQNIVVLGYVFNLLKTFILVIVLGLGASSETCKSTWSSLSKLN
ncbi:hypothetical protein CRYUN_Cryun09bG0061700 [Craigia yunnanensis]